MQSSPVLTGMRKGNSSSTSVSSHSRAVGAIGQVRTAPVKKSGQQAHSTRVATTPNKASTPIASMGVMRQSEAMASPAVRATPKSPPKPPILQRCKFIIKGKVQGVYFRKFTQQKAVELGIFGTVRNEEDGSVTGEAEGRIGNMNDFKLWLLTKGSPKSRVDSADFIDEVGVSGRNYSRFDIDRTP